MAEVFQHHALGCHHSARDRAVRPEVVQEETTWSTLLRCENQAGAGLGKVAYQWARRDAGAQTEFSQMDRRQYTVSNDAHRLAHRCFNHTGSAPSSLSRAYPCLWDSLAEVEHKTDGGRGYHACVEGLGHEAQRNCERNWNKDPLTANMTELPELFCAHRVPACGK